MSSPNLRWLHFSDFHVGKDNYGQRCIFNHIVAQVRKNKDEGWVPDLLILSGDLANKGKKEEYEMFFYDFLYPLQEAIGNRIEQRTFTVPGNHDVDRAVNQAFDRNEIASSEKQYLDPTIEGQKLRHLLQPRFGEFTRNDVSKHYGWVNSADGSFWQIEIVDGVSVGIVGINTAWLCKEENEREKLTPGQLILEESLYKVKDCSIKFVIGHHPLDWLIKSEAKKIRSILGNSSAIYVHGHLHDIWVEPSYGGGYDFITIQAGASFQARDDEKWRNGFLMGEVSIEDEVLRIQPWSWRENHKSWVLQADAFPENVRRGDWWEYNLPSKQLSRKQRTSTKITTPVGWSVKTLDELRVHTLNLEHDTAVNFFNGAVPDWRTAISSTTPRRKVVESLSKSFINSIVPSRPSIGLLLGAGCEGKSTALQQVAYDFLEKHTDWKLICREDETRKIDPLRVQSLLESGHGWLVVIDDADNTAESLFSFLESFPDSLRGKVHFLAACRDSDWSSSGSGSLPWSTVSNLCVERIKGVTEDEAENIVLCWENFGDEGLGRLKSVSKSLRVERLLDASHTEAKVTEGAFFGALLTVRFGEDLNNHAKAMLDRLSQRSIPNGGSLRDALALIAAMHAEEFDFLSRPVLAAALGCTTGVLQRQILRPLGAEAATSARSEYVFTRHLRIAKAIMQVMDEDFNEDIESFYIELAKAAVSLASEGHFVLNLESWRYYISEKFLNTNRPSLAIKIAKALHENDRTDFRSLVTFASLCRKANAADLAVNIFRAFPEDIRVGRGFYTEWGVSEGSAGNSANGVLLSAYSLSDQYLGGNMTAEDVQKGLSSIITSLFETHNKYIDDRLLSGCAAGASMGSHLPDDPGARFFQRALSECSTRGVEAPSFKDASSLLRRAISVASSYVTWEDLEYRIGDLKLLSFQKLTDFIDRVHKQRSNSKD